MTVLRVRITSEFLGFVISSDGQIQGPKGRWLKTFPNKNGYLRFNTYRNGKWAQHSVHTAVCVAFHGPRPDGQLVRHLDGDPLNNRSDNLAWRTYTDNEADKKLHDRHLVGERHHMAKLTEADVREIRSCPEFRGVGTRLAAVYGVNP